MDSPILFGVWIRQRRDGLRLTRKEFARRVGCSVSTLRKIESGERRPSAQIAELIAKCLGISAADHSTFVRVARGDLNVDRLAPPATAAAGPDTASPRINLPVLPTPVIGRQPEIAELVRLLGDPHCRLLTLTGPGGIGKTRLAIETAAEMPAAFAGGVYFVPLAAAEGARAIVPTVADALGFAFESASRADPKIQLFRHLREKQALLVLDNLEHLLAEPGIEVLAEFLAGAPHVKLLATSRESLGLQGEWVFEVRGLPVPETLEAPGFAQDTAVELFLQRARRAQVTFSPSAQDVPAILRICALVAGMPLALELAAAWVRTLSCDEIAQEIERGLDFLSGTTRDLPARHRSMRAVFSHSWRLLSDDEQGVLRRLSVFRGGFRREAAETVAEATLPGLSALVTKSLVQRSGADRYDLHELIRQFAADQFAHHPDEQAATQARHSSYFLAHLSQAGARLRSSAQRETLAELTAEMDNSRAAWDWAISHHDLIRARQAAAALWHVFELRAWLEEGETAFRSAAETLQSRAGAIESSEETLTAVNVMRAHAAYFSFRLGNTAAAQAALLASAAHLRSSADQSAAMAALWYLGIVWWELGDFPQATEILQASLATARACRDPWYQSAAGQFLGIVALDQGEYDLARRHLSEALASARETGDPMLISHNLSFLSLTVQALGETATAEILLRDSLAVAREIGYRWGIGHALDGLGLLAEAASAQEARDLFAASCAVFREIGDPRSLARALNHQGYNALALDDPAEAQKSFNEALSLAREGDYLPFVMEALAGFASLQARLGCREQALELSLILLNQPAILQTAKDRTARLCAELEAQLTKQQVEAAQARAQAKSLEAAVDEALRR